MQISQARSRASRWRRPSHEHCSRGGDWRRCAKLGADRARGDDACPRSADLDGGHPVGLTWNAFRRDLDFAALLAPGAVSFRGARRARTRCPPFYVAQNWALARARGPSLRPRRPSDLQPRHLATGRLPRRWAPATVSFPPAQVPARRSTAPPPPSASCSESRRSLSITHFKQGIRVIRMMVLP
jgi:hypothetical protein